MNDHERITALKHRVATLEAQATATDSVMTPAEPLRLIQH